MKKLLGLIGTITIAGGGMAGLAGNAPTLAKNNINYQQTNNLETLKRNKRQIGIGVSVLTDIYLQNGGFKSPNEKQCENWVRKLYGNNGNHPDCGIHYRGPGWHYENCTC